MGVSWRQPPVYNQLPTYYTARVPHSSTNTNPSNRKHLQSNNIYKHAMSCNITLVKCCAPGLCVVTRDSGLGIPIAGYNRSINWRMKRKVWRDSIEVLRKGSPMIENFGRKCQKTVERKFWRVCFQLAEPKTIMERKRMMLYKDNIIPRSSTLEIEPDAHWWLPHEETLGPTHPPL